MSRSSNAQNNGSIDSDPNKTSQNGPTQPYRAATLEQVLSRLGLPPRQIQLTPEEFAVQIGRVFRAPPLNIALAMPLQIHLVAITQAGYKYDIDGPLIRLPDAASGQTQWTGNENVVSFTRNLRLSPFGDYGRLYMVPMGDMLTLSQARSGALVMRHKAFYLKLALELQPVPDNVRGYEVINHLLGFHHHAGADRILR